MTLRAKTSILLASIIIVTLGSTGVLYVHFLEKSLRNSIFAGVTSVSETSAEAISKFLDDTLNEAKAVGMSLPAAGLEQQNAALIKEYLKAYLDVFPKFENGMFILDKTGKLWVDYPPHPDVKGRSFAFREYFKRTMEEGKGIIGTPYRSARTGQPVVTFTSLLRGSSNQIVGLLGCSIQLLSRHALGGIRNTKIGATGYVYVYDAMRLLILHPQDDRILRRDVPLGVNTLFDAAIEGFEGIGETTNSRGVSMLLSLKRVPDTNWIVGAQQPQTEAFAPIKKAKSRILIGLIIAVGISIVLGALAVGRITKPLARLRREVVKLGGDAEEQIFEILDRGRFNRESATNQEPRDEISELEITFESISNKLTRTMASLKRSARDWERTFDSVQDAIFILDNESRITRLNRAAKEQLQLEYREAIGQHCYTLIHGTDGPPNFCPHRTTISSGKPAWTEMQDQSSGKFYNVFTSPLLDSEGLVCGCVQTMQDITERKRAEKALKESEEKFRGLFNNAADVIAVVGLDGTILELNDKFEEESGYKREEVIGKTIFNCGLLTESSAARMLSQVEELLQDGEPPLFEIEGVGKAGAIIPFELRAVPVLKDRTVVALQAILRNISERKQAEEKLRLSEERFRSLVENAPYGLTIVKSDHSIEYVNPRFTQIFGYGPGDIQSVDDLYEKVFPEAEHREVSEPSRNREIDGDSSNKLIQGEHTIRCADGQKKTIHFENIYLPEGRRLIASEDVTEKKKLQTQVLHAQKMEAVGTLAGGVAHDFNNLLQAINGFTQLMLLDRSEDDRDYSKLRSIQKTGDRAAQLVQQLLLFSRKVETRHIPLEINQEVEQARKLLERTIPKMIDIELRTVSRLWPVKADPVQIEQVMLNLGSNAADAMPDGGKLIIGTENVTLSEEFTQDHWGAKPGKYVLITVSDSGCGMDKETIEHIFEPFYTTKEVGKGTGLGLASVYGIVKSHDGYISCSSEKNHGTTFKIYLPAIEQPDQDVYDSLDDDAPEGGTETILLVEDEDAVRDFASDALSHFGYTVITASNGEEAVDIYTSRKDLIDLVILDIGMPGMGGFKCLQEIIRIDPAAKVVIASGYSLNEQLKEMLEAGAVGYIGKPYRLTDLLKKVKTVLYEV